MLCSVEVTLVRRMSELGLLDQKEANSLVQSVSIPLVIGGESLMVSQLISIAHRLTIGQNRLAYAPKGHLEALAHLITFAPGAARSFSAEVINVSLSEKKTGLS